MRAHLFAQPLLVRGGAFSYRHCSTSQGNTVGESAQPTGDQLSVLFPLVLLPVRVCVFRSATPHPKPFSEPSLVPV